MFRVIGSAVALFVAIVAAALFFSPRQPTASTAPASAPASAAQSTSGQPVPPTAATGQVAFEFDEATLTRLAASGVNGMSIDAGPLGAATVRDLAIQLRSGQIQATGTAQLGPTPLPLTLAATVQAVNGRPHLTLADARIAGVQMPQAARTAVEQTLQAQVDQLIAGQPIRVSSVTVGSGKLTLIGARA